MKKSIVIIVILLALLGSISGIILYRVLNKKEQEEPAVLANTNQERNEVSSIIETVSKDETLTNENTVVIKEVEYEDCSHIQSEVENIKKEYINLNEKNFRKNYDEWEVLNFESDEIKLYKKELGMCGEHFIIRDNEGYVTIFRVKDNNEEEVYETTQIATQYLPEVDYLNVKKGIKAFGMQELNTVLEDFE